jgi:hypothetical protein
MNRNVFVVSFSLVVAGCVTGPIKDFKPIPDRTPGIAAAIAGAKECADPIPAKKLLSPKFKYGCFCGGGYPSNSWEKAGNKMSDKSAKDRLKLIEEEYYTIKPVDDIDAACQDHDICYVLRGRSEYWCDSELHDRLKTMRKVFRNGVSEFAYDPPDTPELRCSNLTNDIDMAAMSLFPSGSGQWLMGWTMRIFKVVTLPLTGIFVAATAVDWDNYPKNGNRCNLRDVNSSISAFNFD